MSRQNQPRDEEIVAAIRSGVRKQSDRALYYLWNNSSLRGSVKKMIQMAGFDEQETGSFLNESLFEFLVQVERGIYNLKESSILTYVSKIAWQKAMTDRRTKKRNKERINKALDANPSNPILNDLGKDPVQEFLTAESEEGIEKAMTEFIGERCRKVIGLKENGYSEQESADLLNLTLSSLKDARKTCKKKWEAFVEHLRNNPEIRKSILGK